MCGAEKRKARLRTNGSDSCVVERRQLNLSRVVTWLLRYELASKCVDFADTTVPQLQSLPAYFMYYTTYSNKHF